jgi:HD superfamily phosphodiesterase
LLIYQDLPQRDKAKINLSVLLAAAMFHDIGFIELAGKEKEKDQHIQLSMIMCVERMNLFGFTKDEIHQTQSIIETHHQKDHSNKNLSQKILYLADKLDLMGIDGTVRNIIRHAGTYQNRDVPVQILKEELSNRVENDLQHLGIVSKILQKKFQITTQFLNSISPDSLL